MRYLKKYENFNPNIESDLIDIFSELEDEYSGWEIRFYEDPRLLDNLAPGKLGDIKNEPGDINLVISKDIPFEIGEVKDVLLRMIEYMNDFGYNDQIYCNLSDDTSTMLKHPLKFTFSKILALEDNPSTRLTFKDNEPNKIRGKIKSIGVKFRK